MKKRMLSVVILAVSAILLSSVFCGIHTSAQTLDIFFDQSWKKYYYIGVPATGGSFELSCMFHTNKNCDIFGQLPRITDYGTDNAFTDSTKFTNHFYLYDKNGVYQIADLGPAVHNASQGTYKTNYTEISGGTSNVYRMKIIVGIAAGISNETYSGKFQITAKPTSQAEGESGAALEVGLDLPVNVTIVIDNLPPVIDEIYAYSGTKKVQLDGATLTEWTPTIRATYHDQIPGSGVKSVWIKLDGTSIQPDEQNTASLYYNVRNPLEEGMHNFTLNVTDYANNYVQETVTFNISHISDITAPTITYVSPAQDEILNITQPTFIAEWHDNENGSGVKLSEFQFAVDGSQYSVPASNISDTGFRYTIATKLHNGEHWWSVYIKDWAGNFVSRLINFTVHAADEFPPSSALTLAGVDGWSIILSLSATDYDGVGVANVTIYYAINSYRDAYGAYAWTRWQIFTNNTTQETFTTYAMFDAKAVRLKKGDTIYFRAVARDWNGNIEQKSQDPDISVVFSPPEEAEKELNMMVFAGLFLMGVVGIGAIIIVWFVGTEKKARRAMRKAKEAFEDAKKAGAEEFFPDKVKELQNRIDRMERSYKKAEYEKVILMAAEIERDVLGLKAETLKMVEEKKKTAQQYDSAKEAVDKAKNNEGEKYVPERMAEIDTLVKEYESLFGKHEFAKAQEIAKEIKEKAEQAEREAIEKKKEEEEKEKEKKPEEEKEAEELEEEIKRLEELKKKLEKKKKGLT